MRLGRLRQRRRGPAAERALAARDHEPGRQPLPGALARGRRLVPQHRPVRRGESPARRAGPHRRRPAHGCLGGARRAPGAARRHGDGAQPHGQRDAADDPAKRLCATRARRCRPARHAVRRPRARATLPRLLGTGVRRQGERVQPERVRHGTREDHAARHRGRVRRFAALGIGLRILLQRGRAARTAATTCRWHRCHHSSCAPG